ncbi:MAG TPA: hypothetical protein VN759_07755, partial [Pseudolysinimonas sp.]|nr:hypothetical protein [Pseudolysinimonas sp.]
MLTLPTDPTAAGNPFDKVDLTGLGAVTFPGGADRVQVDAYVAGAWVTGSAAASAALPDGVTASAVTGLRFTFTSTSGTAIAASGSAGSVVVQLAQRSATRSLGTTLVTGTTVTAAVTGSVVLGSHGSTSTRTTASYAIGGLTSTVDGSTTFGTTASPLAHVPAGTTAPLTVSGKNTSNGPLSTFVVTEDSSVFGPHVTFAGFGTGATWPTGATSAVLSWSVDSGSAPESVTLTAGDALPAPTLVGGQHITGFSIAYAGSIAANTTAVIPVNVAIDATAVDQSAGTLSLTNTVHIDGTNDAGVAPTATRTGTTLVYFPQVKLGLAKSITPSTAIPAGGRSLVRLLATTDSDSGYVHPTTVTIVDQLTGDPVASQYWGAFNAVAIAPTQVPAGSTLVVATTTDGTTWTDVATTTATTAAKVYSGTLANSADVTGIRFTFTDSDGFGQGGSLQGNISFVARSTIRGTSTPTASDGAASGYTNAATATAIGDVVLQDGSTVSATAGQTAPASIKTIPAGSGGLMVGKAWQPVAGSTAVNSQSGQNRTARVTWGTEINGYSTAVVQEPADPTATGAGTVFQNFNLVSIPAITTATDPSIAYDEITKIELFDGTTWTPVGSCTTIAPCAGGMPTAYNLTTPQQNSTVGVRITFAEYALGRLGDAVAPPVGSGVTSGESARPIDFQFQIRNKVRDASALADPSSPWITAQKVYNGTDPGVVVNAARLTLNGSGSGSVSGTAADAIDIIDNPPAITLTKAASPSTIVIPAPADNIAASNYPTETFTMV